MAPDLAFPVASGLLPSGGASLAGTAGAPATAAALARGGALDCWPAIYTPRSAVPAAPSAASDKPLAAPAADLEPVPEGAEGVALALWQDGRCDEAIQVLEQRIALEKRGLPAVILPGRAAGNVLAVSMTRAEGATAQPRRFRPAAIGVLAGGALLLAGAALWNRPEMSSADRSVPRVETAGEAVDAGGATGPALMGSAEREPAPIADAPIAPAPSQSSTAEPDPVPQPAPAAVPAPSQPAGPGSAEAPRTTAPLRVVPKDALAPPVEASGPAPDARLPRGRPAEAAAQAATARAAGLPQRSRREEESAPRTVEPAPATRQPEPRPTAAAESRAPRSRLAEQRAAAERYAGRRRAAAERASGRPDGPSVLLGGRGLP